MGFVVEKIPFRGEIVGSGTGPIIGVGKGFGAGAKNGERSPEFFGTLPDNFADVATRSDIQRRITNY